MLRDSMFKWLRSSSSDLASEISKTLHSRPRDHLWEFSPQYATIAGEGHRRPPPAFGSPTLVWHFGLWLGQMSNYGGRLDLDLDEGLSRAELRRTHRDSFDSHNEAFFQEISELLIALQTGGRFGAAEGLRFDEPHLESATGHNPQTRRTHAFKICEPQSLAFTIWWQDDSGREHPNALGGTPSANDLRVRVHAQTFVDHATISFFIDVGKGWKVPPVFSSGEAVGVRRRALFKHIERIRSVCDEEIRTGNVDLDRMIERGVTETEAKGLLEAAEYLYVGVWREFLDSFFSGATTSLLAAFSGSRIGEVFIDTRGLVFSVAGLSTPHDELTLETASQIRQKHCDLGEAPCPPGADSTLGFGRYHTFDNNCGEPNTILKAYWPFIRRITPDADQRDFVACGILDWRALYVTALGSPAQGGDGEDQTETLPHLPLGWYPEQRSPNSATHHGPRPIRYLVLTKGEPHRQQIGRFVERINAVETMRLFALKNFATVRNASVHIRLLGRELDGILSQWSPRRSEIDEEWLRKRAVFMRRRFRRLKGRNKLPFDLIRGPSLRFQEVEHPRLQELDDERLRKLSHLISTTEADLISLGAALDDIGHRGSGRLLYVINRSSHFIDEFERMARTLEIGNIDTWINYSQFVDRGLSSTFDLIKGTGERLISLRNRLQTITEMIQTGALIVETEATRSNTATLRKVASNWWWTKIGIWGLVGVLLFVFKPEIFQGLKELRDWITSLDLPGL